ncbi:MAG: hypothetical protein AAF587_12835 [Bacteroidota bacterium]
MQLSDQDMMQLEAYWNDTLPVAEREMLERKLTNNPAFKEAAEAWQYIVQDGFTPTQKELDARQTLRQQLQSFESNLPAALESSSRSISRPLILGMGAVAAVVALLFLFNSLRPDLEESRIDELIVYLPPNNQTYSNTWDSAGMEAYKKKDYPLAVEILSQAVTLEDSLYLLYAGIAALQIDQTKKAITFLNYIASSEDWEAYHDHAQWYLALAYAKSREWDKTDSLLHEITLVGKKHEHFSEMQVLSEVMEELR